MTMTTQERVRGHIVSVHAPELAEEEIPGDYDLLINGVIDSLALLELVEWIQKEFGVSAMDTEISPTDLSTIDSISKFIHKNT
ncbi:acyl carrier protein [Nocardiopsis sp. ATB16-24]|uniref:acyl carrier protein n=1 Tax=Nocardiopsis sp. ATB16-24 TaxID=3019555 RepID=UPI0025541037|nr:acyl carrier protein [Nocardiopsis sp. ATB16-24]